MAIFGTPQADEMTLIERDAANRAAAYENLKRQGDLPALGLIFGLNLLKNSQTQGFGQALGGAGMDALANHRAIMDARKKGIDADLNRQTELMRAQEQLNRQDRAFDFDLQKWDYQKKQDAIRNAMERTRIAQAGASSAIAARRLQWEMDQAQRARALDDAVTGILMGGFGSTAQPQTDAQPETAPTEPGLPQIAEIPQPVEQDPFGASPSVPQEGPSAAPAPQTQNSTAPQTRSMGYGMNLSPDQIRALYAAAAAGSERAKGILDMYDKQFSGVIYNPESGRLIDKRSGMAMPVYDPLTGQPISGSVVSPAAEKFAEAQGKKAAEDFDSIQKAAGSAESTIANMDQVDRILDTGLYTGMGGDFIQAVRKGAASLGLTDGEAAANAELMKKISNQMALMARNPDSGMGMPGAMSDKDREFLVSMQPGLNTSVAGNRLMVEMTRRVARRQVEIANMANEYVRRHGILDSGFYNEVRKYSNEHSMFAGLKAPAKQAPSAGYIPAPVTVNERPSLDSFFN